MGEKYLIHKKYDDKFEIEIKNTFSSVPSISCERCSKRIYNGTTHAIFRIEDRPYTVFYYCMGCVNFLKDILQKILNKSTMEDILK